MVGNVVTWIRRRLGPLLLIVLCPPLVMLVWYTNVALDGSVAHLGKIFIEEGVFSTIYDIWSPLFFGTPLAWKMIALFIGFELLLMQVLPGRWIEGALTPKGNMPLYKANGVFAFLCTIGAFLLASEGFHLFSATIIYDHFGEILGALNLFSLLFCLLLYVKGKYYPSSSDEGSTGSVIFDYFWGRELNPRIGSWDVKMFTNCRFGMMAWALILLSFAATQQQQYGLCNTMGVAVLLQLLYIAKFFVWEPGYLRSMDIIHDRAGFCLCWGCMVWVPAIYTSPTLFLVNHPNHLEGRYAILIGVVGAIAVFVNYLADRQRQRVRRRQRDCTVWNRQPELIFANYQTDWGEERQSVLLTSGWWGLSRHFHYLPEVVATICWSIPALFDYYIPYFYLTFLVFLLVDRAYRQERRCARKYGDNWQEYCRRVPFRLIPFIY